MVPLGIHLAGLLENCLGAKLDANFTTFTAFGDDKDLTARHSDYLDVERRAGKYLHYFSLAFTDNSNSQKKITDSFYII